MERGTSPLPDLDSEAASRTKVRRCSCRRGFLPLAREGKMGEETEGMTWVGERGEEEVEGGQWKGFLWRLPSNLDSTM